MGDIQSVRRARAARARDLRPIPDATRRRSGQIHRVPASSLLACVAAVAVGAWGVAHLAPTKRVADGFGSITTENRRILIVEWIAEGITHVSLGVLVILITAIEGSGDPASHLVYRVSAGILVVLAGLTTATGARTPIIWFRVCPFVLTGAAILLVLASTL
jgi:hypothetical protein